jgi:hypothetical protein
MRRLPQRREKVTNLASVLLPREAVAKASKQARRRLVATVSHWPAPLPLRLLQRRVGAGALRVTSIPVKYPAVMTAVYVAQCTTLRAIAPESVRKSKSSWTITMSN